MRIDVKRCAEILKEQDNIRIICHKDPDGDTIGSAMALCDALSSMGKKVFMSCFSPIPDNLKFIVRDYEKFEPQFIVAVDISVPKLFGDGEIRNTPVDLCIDHHISNEFYAKDTCLYTFSSAGELTYDIIKEMGVKISPYCATCLLTAVSSDTGSFKYSDVTAKTLKTGSLLLELGADKDEVRKNLYESNKKSRMIIEGMALSNMKFYDNDRIAVISVSEEMMEKCGADEDDLIGLASLPITVMGVDVGITLKEKQKGLVKISVRTSENADACLLCKAFAGGGHVRASGCSFEGSLEDAEKALIEEARKQIL